MGDRGNVKIIEVASKPAIYFYSHWGGSDLALRVQRALGRRERWDDPPYFRRIVFCEILAGGSARANSDEIAEALRGATGFGIALEECDPEHPTIVVDLEQRVVYVDGTGERVPFETFIAMPEELLRAWHQGSE